MIISKTEFITWSAYVQQVIADEAKLPFEYRDDYDYFGFLGDWMIQVHAIPEGEKNFTITGTRVEHQRGGARHEYMPIPYAESAIFRVGRSGTTGNFRNVNPTKGATIIRMPQVSDGEESAYEWCNVMIRGRSRRNFLKSVTDVVGRRNASIAALGAIYTKYATSTGLTQNDAVFVPGMSMLSRDMGFDRHLVSFNRENKLLLRRRGRYHYSPESHLGQMRNSAMTMATAEAARRSLTVGMALSRGTGIHNLTGYIPLVYRTCEIDVRASESIEALIAEPYEIEIPVDRVSTFNAGEYENLRYLMDSIHNSDRVETIRAFRVVFDGVWPIRNRSYTSNATSTAHIIERTANLNGLVDADLFQACVAVLLLRAYAWFPAMLMSLADIMPELPEKIDSLYSRNLTHGDVIRKLELQAYTSIRRQMSFGLAPDPIGQTEAAQMVSTMGYHERIAIIREMNHAISSNLHSRNQQTLSSHSMGEMYRSLDIDDPYRTITALHKSAVSRKILARSKLLSPFHVVMMMPTQLIREIAIRLLRR